MRRYPSYKDSGVEWIGEIPEGWETIRLGMLGTFSSSGIDKKSNDNETPIRMVNYTDITSSKGRNPLLKSDFEYMRVTTPQSKLVEHRLRKGDLVFIPSSETLDDLGVSSVIDFEEDDIVFSYHIIRFQPSREIFHYFKKYLVNHHSILSQFSSEGKGTTRQIIGRYVFRNVKVVLPPLSEQTQIVSYLDRKTEGIDKLIQTKVRKIELLKEYRTSIISKVVTKGLNPNVEMKDSGVEWIGEIPSHWEIKRLKYFCEMVNEKGIPDEGEIKISPENVENNSGVCLNLYSEYSGEGVKFTIEDILLNKLRLYLKKFLFTEYEGYSMGEMIVLRIISGEKRYYFLSLFHQGLIDELDNQSTGVKLPRVSPEVILNTKFPIPSPSEQTQIVSYLDEQTQLIDKNIQTEERKIELLKEFRQSLISEVVTGKIKVCNDEEVH